MSSTPSEEKKENEVESHSSEHSPRSEKAIVESNDASSPMPADQSTKANGQDEREKTQGQDSGYDEDCHGDPSKLVDRRDPPSSPVAPKNGTSDDSPTTDDEKGQMTPLAPPYHHPYPPNAGGQPQMHPGYHYPYPNSPPPAWGYYPGYYPPPYPHYPPPTQSGSAAIAPSPYYPPLPHYPPPPPDSSNMPPPSSDQDPPPPYPPSSYPHPYYPGYHLPPASAKSGPQPPMSPLMQQPLFNSPGPSPAAYHSSYYGQHYAPPPPNSKHPYPTHASAGSSAPPYFPPAGEFGKSEVVAPLKKSNVTKNKQKRDANEMMNAVPSAKIVKRQERGKTPKRGSGNRVIDESIAELHTTLQSDVVMSDEYVDDGDENGESIATDPSSVNPVLLATYVKSRQPTNQDELKRRSRKNSQARARADARKNRIAEIEAKEPEDRTAEEEQFLGEYEQGRGRKNDRSRSRATENKEKVDEILKKPPAQRTKLELQFLDQYMSRKQRKNEGDRLRRERLKMLGLDSKKPLSSTKTGRPSVTARGPLPPTLLALAAKKKDSPDDESAKDKDPYRTYGIGSHYPPMSYPAYHGYPPPPYWADPQGLYAPPPALPTPAPDDEGRQMQYHKGFSIYPTENGPVATTSWATPPRPGNSKRKKAVVTSDVHTKTEANPKNKRRPKQQLVEPEEPMSSSKPINAVTV